jgi:phosphohistidine phosphatase
MLKLYLLRHAKSSWDEKNLDDRDRPLTRRGRVAAQAMGRLLEHRGLLPELVLCSPARRTRDTWEIAAGELKTAPKLVIDDQLYDFGNGGRLLEIARQKGGKAKSLMIVAHNPAIERLARRLVGAGDEKLVKRLEAKYPTGALAAFEVNAASWAALDETQTRLTHFIRPKDILPED